MKYTKGFTYIEIILYIAIVMIMMSALIPFAWNMIGSGVKSATQQEVFGNARYISERISYEIRKASDINSVSATQISLATTNPATNPTIIAVTSGNISIKQGAGSAVNLNSNNTRISNIAFTNYSSPDTKTKNIGYTFTLNANYTGAGSRQEYNESTTIEGSAEVRSN